MSAPVMANKPRADITVTVAKGQSVAVAGHVLTEQSFEEHGQAESECGHDRDGDHRADTRIFDERINSAFARQEIAKNGDGDNDQTLHRKY